jgi:ATP-dependent DNA helicase RecG
LEPNDHFHSAHKKINYPIDTEEISQVEWEILLNIGARARQCKKLPPEELEKIILRLCKDRWMTRNQLANLLGRNPDSLRSRFLTHLVRHHLLQLRYPEKPNRVDQAYKIKTPSV